MQVLEKSNRLWFTFLDHYDGQPVRLAAQSSFVRRHAILPVALVRNFPAPTVEHSLQAREEQGPWPTLTASAKRCQRQPLLESVNESDRYCVHF
jgi:hypothetical protein